jgi:hypothetical protein
VILPQSPGIKIPSGKAAYDYNSETVLRNKLARISKRIWAAHFAGKDGNHACLLKQMNALPGKLVLEVYEPADFKRGSKKSRLAVRHGFEP